VEGRHGHTMTPPVSRVYDEIDLAASVVVA
jgi:hypothetical protein